jgi:hypothetical protein
LNLVIMIEDNPAGERGDRSPIPRSSLLSGRRYTVPLRVLFVLALVVATVDSPNRATATASIPPESLRSSLSLCERVAGRTRATPVVVPTQSARLKMIREGSNDGDCLRTAVSAPLSPVARARVPWIGPAGTPYASPPHLRC